ncbi:hypothetical protein ACQ4LE_009479 [Meloidogyne hapla]
MLTPFFQLQQNDIYLIVKIRAPYCKLSDAEVTYGDREFVFNATPYFLRLFLTGDVIDDETGTCEYDSEKESLFATQKLCSPTDNVLIENNKFGYGFGWLRNEVLGKFKEEIADLIDLDDPENILIEERNQKLKEFDEKHFSEQYYLADLFSQEQYQNEAMQFYLDKKYLILAEEDCSDLKDLRIRKLEKFTKEINEKIALSLVDIIFGFAYDFRTTLGEHSVESGWTISKLSPSLTFIVKWSNMQEAMSSTIRHSLVLPMIRNWELSLKVLHDVQTIIENGCSSIYMFF